MAKQIVEGLKIQISSADLKKHLLDRSRYHKDKVTSYRDQVVKLNKIQEANPLQSNNPIQSLESSAKSHQQKAAYFSFLATYMIPNATYQLTHHELESLEIFIHYM